MVLCPAFSQELLLEILNAISNEYKYLPESFLDDTGDKLKNEYISLCVSFANEKAGNSDYCSNLDDTCIKLLKEAHPEKSKINKSDVCQAFGWTSGNYTSIGRTENLNAVMQTKNLNMFCEKCNLDDSPRGRFYRNLIVFFLPNYGDIYNGITEDLEYQCLLNIIGKLTQKELGIVCDKFSESKTENEKTKSELITYIYDVLMSYKQECDAIDKIFNEQSPKLYEIIKALIENWNGRIPKDTKKNEYRLSEAQLRSFLTVDDSTWLTWKHKWQESQEHYFETAPKPRMKREHMLLISLKFRLKYLHVLRFIQIGGYRFSNTTEDSVIIRVIVNNTEIGKIKELHLDETKPVQTLILYLLALLKPTSFTEASGYLKALKEITAASGNRPNNGN